MDQKAPQEKPLIHASGTSIRIRCPWCERWEPEEAFIELQTPPNYPEQCGIVLKHRCGTSTRGTSGTSSIFTIRDYRRPSGSVA